MPQLVQDLLEDPFELKMNDAVAALRDLQDLCFQEAFTKGKTVARTDTFARTYQDFPAVCLEGFFCKFFLAQPL